MYYGFGNYISVAEQRQRALEIVEQLRSAGKDPKPVDSFSGPIAKTFWGKKWCENLENYADWENRLARGKRYVRAGSVCHLEVEGGKVFAVVSGGSPYSVHVDIKPLPQKIRAALCAKCSASISSLRELISGKLDREVMAAVCDSKSGLFPKPGEISFSCSCPDYAGMCKHVASVMYALGRRMDDEPELVFQLRGVNPEEMINLNLSADLYDIDSTLQKSNLEEIFGIELDPEACALAAAPGKIKIP